MKKIWCGGGSISFAITKKDKGQIHIYFETLIPKRCITLRLHIKRKKDRSLLQFDHVKPLIENV